MIIETLTAHFGRPAIELWADAKVRRAREAARIEVRILI